MPDKTILSNKFIQVTSTNQYVLALAQNGIAVLECDESDSFFVQNDYFHLITPARSMKVQGVVLAVRDINDDLTFLDLSTLPDLTLLGTVSPTFDYYDFAVVGDDLYFSRWFDGVDRYRMTDYSSLLLIANERTPVVATQLERSDNWLYALDMYNGIVRYAFSIGFGNVVERLVIDQRPFAISLAGDIVFISMSQDGALIGKFNGSSGEIVAEIHNVPSPNKVLPVGKFFAFLSPRELNVFQDDLSLDFSITTDAGVTSGDLVELNSESYLVAPGETNGLTKIGLSSLVEPVETLNRPGPISSALLYNEILLAGGAQNPLESYKIIGDSLLAPELLRGNSRGVSDLAINGNQLYALYAGEKKVLLFDLAVPDDISATDSFLISTEKAEKLLVQDSLLLVIGKNQIEPFTNGVQSTAWNFANPIVDASVIDNKLFVSNVFGSIEAYSIQSGPILSKCGERDLTGTGWAMISFDNKLFVFVGNTLTVFKNCLELDTIVHLPQYVLDAQIGKDTLFAVGPNGIAKYDLSSGLPALIEAGGIRGSQISTNGKTIATTDGSSINLYFDDSEVEIDEQAGLNIETVLLYENFPDPFNAKTNIQFELPFSANIELSIYNLLGQRVKTLANGSRPGGRYLVSWDGRDEQGNVASSGIYFYRLLVEDETFSRKMLLLK
ncbi:MAG: FlgD immunoglobulin-like domain containing protein [Candidatus Zixiibacteriota bacterium]